MRRHYLDNIRWITVLIVMVYHVIYMYNGVQLFGVIGPFKPVQYQDAFQYIVYPWFMVLLFAVSGMSSRYYLDGHTDKEFRESRTQKLLIPSTLGIIVFHWTVGYYNTAISGAFNSELANVPGFVKAIIMILSGTGPLWFIQMLWVFSILLVIIRKFEKDKIWELGKKVKPYMLVIFTIVIYGAAQILNTPVVTVYRFGIYGVSFFVGYFVLSHEEVTDRLMQYWIPLCVAAIVLGASYTIIYFGENYATEPVINNVLACVYCWICVLAIIAAMKKWFNFSTAFTEFMCKKSWGLYIFHYLPLAMTAYYLKEYASSTPALVCYLLVGIMTFVGAYVVNEIISRIPVLRYLVLGIRGK